MDWTFLSWLTGVRSLLRRQRPYRRSPGLRAQPSVEELERRLVPASLLYVYTGPVDTSGLFSAATSWLDLGTGKNATPQNNDTLIFDPTQSVGGTQGSNMSAQDDMVNLSLTQLTLGSQYTMTIQLSTRLDVMALNMASGNISGGATGRLSLDASMTASTWTGGTMSGHANTAVEAGATLNIGGNVTLDDRVFLVEDGGKVNWNDGGINMANGASITDSGTWTTNGDLAMSYAGGAMGYFSVMDTGTFAKPVGQQGDETTVQVPFNVSSTNQNAVNVSQGTLQLTGGGYSSSIYQVAATSTVDFGITLGLPTATASWGTGTNFQGNGTVAIESIVNIAANNTANAVNVTLDSGTVQGGGTLVISGNLNWPFGIMQNGNDGPGQTILAKGATATLGGNAITDRTMFVPILSGRVFQNNGVVKLSGPAQGPDPGPITFQVNYGATINNVGSFNFLDDSGMAQVAGTAPS